MNKQKVLKIALKILFQYGNITIEHLSETAALDKEGLTLLFSNGDKELLMDTVEYAGTIWVDKIKKEISEQKSVQGKLRTLASGYALGSREHPQSLSIYIDLWKYIKDGNNEYIKKRLCEIYRFYIDEFNNIVNNIGEFHATEKQRRALSLFITILSDVLHIQSITLENEVDFDSFQEMIENVIVLFFTGKNDE